MKVEQREKQAMVVWGAYKFKADANKVYSELETIKDRTPQNIVDFAKDENAELHKCFNWDDEFCANEYRKQTARIIVCNLVFEEKKTKEPTRIRVMQNTGRTYEPVRMILQNKDEYEALLERAYAELRSFKERYKNLTELEEILALID